MRQGTMRLLFPHSLVVLGLVIGTGGGGCGYRLARLDPPPLQPFSAPPSGLAQVCVLRPRLAPADLVFAVHDNGILMGATRGSSYFCYLAQPGGHRITSSRLSVTEEISVMAQAGTRYFLYQNVDPYPDATRSWLSWSSEAEARNMIGECTYRVVTGAPSGQEPPGERPLARADTNIRAASVSAPAKQAPEVALPDQKLTPELPAEPEAPPVAPAPPATPANPASKDQVTDAGTAPKAAAKKGGRGRKGRKPIPMAGSAGGND